jgi:DNA polymerase
LKSTRFKTLPKRKPIVSTKTDVVDNLAEHFLQWACCKKCPLHKLASCKVFHRGAFRPKILFVGEAPGESEDSLGQPFVGVSGKLIDLAISEAGIEGKYRSFTNTVLCAPYEDKSRSSFREPAKDEMKACSPRLKEIIEILKPEKIVALGNKAKQALTMLKVDFLAYVHPAYILRKGGAESVDFKRLVLQLKKLKQELGI